MASLSFFYTWTPNWTVFKLLPGEDVLWINVPEIKPTEAQQGKEEFMVVKDAVGTVTNPVKLGFVVSDIRAVANKKIHRRKSCNRKIFLRCSHSLLKISVSRIQR